MKDAQRRLDHVEHYRDGLCLFPTAERTLSPSPDCVHATLINVTRTLSPWVPRFHSCFIMDKDNNLKSRYISFLFKIKLV